MCDHQFLFYSDIESLDLFDILILECIENFKINMDGFKLASNYAIPNHTKRNTNFSNLSNSHNIYFGSFKANNERFAFSIFT